MARRTLSLLACLFFGLLIVSQTHGSLAASCRPGTVSATGTATTKAKAQRNAKISLGAKLNKAYPGDVRSRMRGSIGYACKNPLLWSCKASVKICR